jgi:predicted amidohydrolase
MNIGIAQIRSITGDIQVNLDKHKQLIHLAIAHRANIIVFPELSLTNYAPKLAKKLAIEIDDPRLDCLQTISDAHSIVIGAGAPVNIHQKIYISMILFQPKKQRQAYFKQYLHPDEEKFFASRANTIDFLGAQKNMALAICYELSVPEHAENAYSHGAQIYCASVAKTVPGVEKAILRLAEIANQYSMITFMSNCVGELEGGLAGGRSSVWNNRGILVGQLDDKNEGLLISDGKEIKSEIFND